MITLEESKRSWWRKLWRTGFKQEQTFSIKIKDTPPNQDTLETKIHAGNTSVATSKGCKTREGMVTRKRKRGEGEREREKREPILKSQWQTHVHDVWTIRPSSSQKAGWVRLFVPCRSICVYSGPKRFFLRTNAHNYIDLVYVRRRTNRRTRTKRCVART